MILWLLEELETPYNLELYERVDGRAPPELKKVHPRGKSPVLVTATGRVIVERSAIALHLISTYDTAGRFQIPAGTAADADPAADTVHEDYLMSLANASLGPLLVVGLVLNQLAVRSPFFVRPLFAGLGATLNRAFLNAELDGVLRDLDAQLQGRDYLMGRPEPTRAEFVVLWHVDSGHQGGYLDLDKYPNVKAWHARCTARPAWKRALEKGNGYNVAF
jgi:glutathione S-transferase